MIVIAVRTMSLMSGHTSCMSCWIAGITDANVAPMLPIASMTDAFTLLVVALPIWLLYEVSIFIVKLNK